jgi:hypothetical protein
MRDMKSAAPEITMMMAWLRRLYTLFTEMWQDLFFTMNYPEGVSGGPPIGAHGR